jgi:VWFA-related protein
MRRVAFLLGVALAAAPLFAQQQAIFRSAVDVISVPVSVTDKNKPVPNLTADDFELLDNNVRQQISLTALDAMPTDVTFVVDVSGSIAGKALERIKADVQAMSELLQPNDRVRLVSFARDPVDVFGLMPGGAALDFSRMTSGGTTSLYDALIAVLASQAASERPQMVFVVTDGRDNSSFSTAAHMVRVARTSGAVLSVALVQSSNPLVREGGKIDAVDPMASEQSTVNIPGLTPLMGANTVTPGSKSSSNSISRSVGPYRGGPNLDALREASAATGGLVYSDATRTPIPDLFRRILDDFRAGYVLSYEPAGVNQPGTHTISVQAKNRKLLVRARKSYEQR